ncbi:MAG TPA: L,D-transpeptidase family protein, partial [Acidobacteriota bacterium]|nr:L,D-transpeptidase family protein [Acidobacteriota bacterium]
VQIMRVIVGKTTWCTPTFLSSTIDQIILNPAWYVPSIIASKEIYPLLKKDPGYLKRNNIRMIPRADGGVQLRQSPGPHNALGRVKFLFPNCCDCYLHDTPDKQLFDQVLRLFSHGCIRIEKAFDLASWILEEEVWSTEKLAAAIQSTKTQTIRLSKPVAIFSVYFTAWVEEYGLVQFRQDVYGKDKELSGR